MDIFKYDKCTGSVHCADQALFHIKRQGAFSDKQKYCTDPFKVTNSVTDVYIFMHRYDYLTTCENSYT